MSIRLPVLLFTLFITQIYAISPIEIAPALYNGRIRPLTAYSQSWQREWLNQNDENPIATLLDLEFDRDTSKQKKLFNLQNKHLKNIFNLSDKNTLSYNDIYTYLYLNPNSNKLIIKLFINYFYSKSDKSKQDQGIELSDLSDGLIVKKEDGHYLILQKPNGPLWSHITENEQLEYHDLSLSESKAAVEELFQMIAFLDSFESKSPDIGYLSLLKKLKDENRLSDKEIALQLEAQFPTSLRIKNAGSRFLMLPGKNNNWYPIAALGLKVYDGKTGREKEIPNFTVFTNGQFSKIRKTYFELAEAYSAKDSLSMAVQTDRLAEALLEGYSSLQKSPYLTAEGKSLRYPSLWQLKAEYYYYKWPLSELCLLGYGAACLLFLASHFYKAKWLSPSAFWAYSLAFAIHTCILALRIYILDRAPVSNMHETVIYVPWITALSAYLLYLFFRNDLLFFASSLCAFVLLLIMKMKYGVHELENVQAVLDSQYWLIIHVLMIVASYGVFIFCAALGHIYLISKKRETIGKMVLQTMYIGTALLIPGTVLGGVWAAESWGRFWDWDPKESWAFISSCVYLIFIHAFRYRLIGYFGLAIGSIIGLQAIVFTWYGVNYLLGTGLHSYGFGSGGEIVYFSFVGLECSVIAAAMFYFPILKKTI